MVYVVSVSVWGEMYVRGGYCVCGWGGGVLSIVWWWCIDGGVWRWCMMVYDGGVWWCMVMEYGGGGMLKLNITKMTKRLLTRKRHLTG